MGFMGLTAISGSLETKGANTSKIVCGNHCIEFKLSFRISQLPRWRSRSPPLPQAGELAPGPTNSSSTRMSVLSPLPDGSFPGNQLLGTANADMDTVTERLVLRSSTKI